MYRSDFKNILLNASSAFLPMLLSFTLAPLLIKYFGLSNYGLIALQLLINGYIAVIERPFGIVLSKFVSAIEACDYREFSEQFHKKYFYFFSSSIAVLLIISPFIMKLIANDINFFLLCMISITILSKVVENVLKYGLLGSHLQVAINLVQISGILLRFVVIIGVTLYLNGSILHYFVITAITSMLISVYYIVKIRSIYRRSIKKSNKLSLTNWSEFEYIIKQSVLNFFSSIVSQMDKFLIASNYDRETLAVYSLLNLTASINAIFANQICNSWLHHLNAATDAFARKKTIFKLGSILCFTSLIVLTTQIFFSRKIMDFFFSVDNTPIYYNFLMISFFINAIYYLFITIQNISYDTKTSRDMNIIYLLGLPLLIKLNESLGIEGVVYYLLILQLANITIGVQLTMKRGKVGKL